MKRRFDNLDAIRAVAIMSVLIYHYSARFPESYTGLYDLPFHYSYGWLGVDIFFVLSGYCLGMTLGRARTTIQFWSMRVARIQPAYMLGVLITFTCVFLVGLPGREVSALSAISNLVWFNAIPTLNIPHVDGAYWSLVVELKFYLWIGVLLKIFGRRNLASAWAGFTFLGGLIALLYPKAGEIIFISPYAPMFLFGIVALGWTESRSWILPLFLLEAVLFTYNLKRMEGIEVIGCLIGIGTMVAIMMKNVWIPQPIAWLGLVSYPLYLVHQNIGLLVIREFDQVDPLLRILLAVIVSVTLAAIIHYSVETRYQRRVANSIERGLTLLKHSYRRSRLQNVMLSFMRKQADS